MGERLIRGFACEKALREALVIEQKQGSWDDWKRRWPPAVRRAVQRELGLMAWLANTIS